jgi:hypothetical protein
VREGFKQNRLSKSYLAPEEKLLTNRFMCIPVNLKMSANRQVCNELYCANHLLFFRLVWTRPNDFSPNPCRSETKHNSTGAGSAP